MKENIIYVLIKKGEKYEYLKGNQNELTQKILEWKSVKVKEQCEKIKNEDNYGNPTQRIKDKFAEFQKYKEEVLNISYFDFLQKLNEAVSNQFNIYKSSSFPDINKENSYEIYLSESEAKEGFQKALSFLKIQLNSVNEHRKNLDTTMNAIGSFILSFNGNMDDQKGKK